MSFQNYLILFLAATLGQFLHIFAIKIPATKERYRVANTPFSVGCYFRDDMIAIVANVITILIVLITLNELVKFKPAVVPWLRALFVFIGFTGSSLLIAVLGKASANVNKVIDVKTDIADKAIDSKS